MPEMPEVEIIRRYLNNQLVGKTIKEVAVYLPRLIKHPEVNRFTALAKGKKVNNINRLGKYI